MNYEYIAPFLTPEERNTYLLVLSTVIFYAHMFCDRISYSEKLEMNYLPLLINFLKVFRLRTKWSFNTGILLIKIQITQHALG
jgi:hypothetical protein